jgi:hypothetical protein
MGIGRRQFLLLFGASIGALAANPSSAIVILDDQYVNRKLGIAFRKPKGWTFADVKEMGEVQAGQILDLDDPDMARELVDSYELPVLTISRDRLSSNSNRFTPGVTIYLDRFEFLASFPQVQIPPLENLGNDIERCESLLKDFRVTSPPKLACVSECDAAEYTASFVFEHKNIKPIRVRMLTLAVFQNPAFYTIRMHDSPYASPDTTFDYRLFVESVRMV